MVMCGQKDGSTLLKKGVFSTIYFAVFLCYFIQGFILTYLTNIHKPYLSSLGVSFSKIGFLSAVLVFPFVAKIPLAYVSDRYPIFKMGNRLPYILLGLLITSCCSLFILVVSPKSHFIGFSFLLFSMSMGIALIDASIDGFALDVSKYGNEHIVQSVMLFSRSVAIMLSSIGFGYLIDKGNVNLIFTTISIVAGLIIVFLFGIKTKIISIKRHFQDNKNKKNFQMNKNINLMSFYGFLYCFICWGVIEGLSSIALEKIHLFSGSKIGFYGFGRGIGMVIGAILAGSLLKKSGLKSLLISHFLMLIGAVALIFQPLSSDLVLLSSVIWGIGFGLQMVTFTTYLVKIIDVNLSAMMFAIVIAICNVGLSVSHWVSTSLLDIFSIQNVLSWFSLSIIPLFLISNFVFNFSAKKANTGELT